MENQQELQQSTPMKKSFWSWPGGWASYVVVGAIFYYAQNYNKSVIDGIIIIVVSISCGYSYHYFNSKSKIKNETLKAIITFIGLILLGMLCISFFTSFGDVFINNLY